MAISYHGLRNLERLLACLRDIGVAEALEGEFDRKLLEAGNPRPMVMILRLLVCGVSSIVADDYYQKHEWFIVPLGDEELVRTVWALLREEYGYEPGLSAAQFQSTGHAEKKIAILVDVLRLVEKHHNNLAKEATVRAEYQKNKSKWIEEKASELQDPAERRRQVIKMDLGLNTFGDLDKSLSPTIPFNVNRRPVRSSMKTARGFPNPILASHPKGFGLKFFGGTIDVKPSLSQDEVTQHSRTAHPDYSHYVVEGLKRTPNNRLSIPDHSVLRLQCCDGASLATVTNANIPPGKRLKEHVADFTLSSVATDDGVTGVPPSPPAPPKKDKVYIKKFPQMLERAVLKKVKLVAPATCEQEHAEMLELFARSNTLPPVVDSNQKKTFWMARSSILHKLRDALAKKYPDNRVVLHEPPNNGGREKKNSEESDRTNGDVFGKTLHGHTIHDMEKREQHNGHEAVIQGMKWKEEKKPDHLQTLLSSVGSLTSVVLSLKEDVRVLSEQVACLQSQQCSQPPSGLREATLSSSSLFFNNSLKPVKKKRQPPPPLLGIRKSDILTSVLHNSKAQPVLKK